MRFPFGKDKGCAAMGEMFYVTLKTMKKALLLALVLCAGVALRAQKLYYIFIESDTRAPFYVKMGDKVFSAAGTGYLILPKLKDSVYNFRLGPSANEGELQFSVPVRQKDRGFLLKQFLEGWGLFDLQTMQVLMPENKSGGLSATSRVRNDHFTALLALAADDTTLFYQAIPASAVAVKPSAAEAPPIAAAKTAVVTTPVETPAVVAASTTETEKNAAVKDSIAAPEHTAVVSAAAPDTVVSEPKMVVAPVAAVVAEARNAVDSVSKKTTVTEQPSNTEATVPVSEVADAAPADTTAAAPYQKSKVMRRAESSTVDGFGLTFWDHVDGKVDTIKIFIANQKFQFADPEVSVAAPKSDAGTSAAVSTAAVAAPTACSNMASEKEFFRLRRNLVTYDAEPEMAAAARNAFKKNCYTTEQIRNLCALFLTQEGKWLFLEAAYPHVSDKTQFLALQSELREEPYLGRFKALTGK